MFFSTGELHYQMADGDATHVLTDTDYAQKVLNVCRKLNIKVTNSCKNVMIALTVGISISHFP